MTSPRESWAAGKEALHQVMEHPEESSRHEDALNRYLAGVTDVELRKEEEEAEHAHPTRSGHEH